MLGKVLKHDLIALGKKLIPMFIVCLGLSIFTRIFNLISEHIEFFKTISLITNIFTIIVIIAILFITFITCIKRYINHLFNAEGYLTNTLPVSKATLVNSKIISSSIYFLLAVVVMISSLVILCYSKGLMESIKDIIEPIKQFIPLMLISPVVGYLSNYLLVIAAYSLGQLRVGNRTTNAIVSGFLLYIANQVIGFIGVGILFLIQPNFFVQQENLSLEYFSTVIWLSVSLGIIVLLMYYVVTLVSINKKMDIE